MNYKSIAFPIEFIEKIKSLAKAERRSISQQIMHLVDLAINFELTKSFPDVQNEK